MKTSDIRKKLSKLISGDVFWSKEVLDCYSVDSSSYRMQPKLVVFPRNKQDVIKIVKFASKNKIGITPRGGGTGLVGSAVGNQIIMDLKLLDKIKITNDYVLVESGTPKGKLDLILEKNKKFLGPNPSVGTYCRLGGMIATNASGSRSLKYGSIIDNLLEIEFVDGLGNVINFPTNSVVARKIRNIAKKTSKNDFPEVSKNSCGYRLDKINSISDVQKIIAGSEGTLGIIVSAKLKIFPKPNIRNLLIVAYNSIFDAMNDCPKINKIKPAALEFVDEITLQNIDYKMPKNTKCLLFIEIDTKLERSKTLIKFLKGKLIKLATKEDEIKKWWKYRDSSLSFSLKNILKSEKAPHIIEDAGVPVNKLSQLIQLIKKIEEEYNCRAIMYGHAGNGNIHVRLITKQKNKKLIKEIATKYFAHVNKLGGTITAEHGDGLARTDFIKGQYGSKTYQRFKELKKILDPNGILNPDKIISKKSQIIENLELK